MGLVPSLPGGQAALGYVECAHCTSETCGSIQAASQYKDTRGGRDRVHRAEAQTEPRSVETTSSLPRTGGGTELPGHCSIRRPTGTVNHSVDQFLLALTQ